jgi:hypothetical protein
MAEMGTWRKTARETRYDRIRSQDIRRQDNVQKIREWMTERRDEWNKQVSRDGTREN